MNYSETYFDLDSEEATHCDHCHIICCVYIKGHVKMVDIKDQSNAIVYDILFVDTVDMKLKAHNALNAVFVETVDTTVKKHIHTFLPITFLIFNWFSIRKKFWKAETEGFSIPSNTIYVDTVDTSYGILYKI